MQVLETKPAFDIITIVFNFTAVTDVLNYLDGVNVSLVAGTDPNPSSQLIGAPILSGNKVYQKFKGAEGCIYKLTARVSIDATLLLGNHSVDAIIQVKTCQPVA